MGRGLESVRFWHWNLADPVEGDSAGQWQHDEHSLPMASGQLRELSVTLTGFQPLQADARTAAAWIGITRASFIDLGGWSQQIDADLATPLSWPRSLAGVFVTFRVSMVVVHAQAGFQYCERLYGP